MITAEEARNQVKKNIENETRPIEELMKPIEEAIVQAIAEKRNSCCVPATKYTRVEMEDVLKVLRSNGYIVCITSRVNLPPYLNIRWGADEPANSDDLFRFFTRRLFW